MKLIIQSILHFLLLVLVQVLILNNIKFLGFINPYIYILFIITLPVNVNKTFLLLLAFVLGLSIDIFCNTLGVHAFATVFVAFFRENIIKLLIPRDDNYDLTVPSMHTFGRSQFVKYTIMMVFVHHTILLLIEAFSLYNFWFLLLRILFNSTFTILLILGIERIKVKK